MAIFNLSIGLGICIIKKDSMAKPLNPSVMMMNYYYQILSKQIHPSIVDETRLQ